jgi:hypothetical protein
LGTALAAAVSALPAGAQVTAAAGYTPPDDTQSIKVGAVVFYDWTSTRTPKSTDAAGNAIAPNAFNVARTYINVTGNVSHRVAFRITPDITRETTPGGSLNGNLVFRLKYGYAQFALDDWTGAWKQSYVRAGIQQTPFIDGEESVYRYRFQGTVFAERDGGLSSSDAGVSFHTALPDGYGDVHGGVYNGEGYSKAEANDQKSFQLRGSFRPMPRGSILARGLRFTAFVNRDHVIRGAERSRAIGSVWYEHPRVNAGFDFITGVDRSLPAAARIESRGWSAFVTPFLNEKGNGLEGLVRYDSFQADTAARFEGAVPTRNRLIAGAAWWFPHPSGPATAALLLDYERVTFDHAMASAATAAQRRVAVHGLINF